MNAPDDKFKQIRDETEARKLAAIKGTTWFRGHRTNQSVQIFRTTRLPVLLIRDRASAMSAHAKCL
jgi:hypothetical protein